MLVCTEPLRNWSRPETSRERVWHLASHRTVAEDTPRYSNQVPINIFISFHLLCLQAFVDAVHGLGERPQSGAVDAVFGIGEVRHLRSWYELFHPGDTFLGARGMVTRCKHVDWVRVAVEL